MNAADNMKGSKPTRSEGTGAAICVLNAFESMGYGGFLLDRGRQVFAHNRIAANCLGDGLTLRGRCLAATDRESDARLQSLIEAVMKSVDRLDRPASVGVRRDFRLPLVVRILRLADGSRPTLNSARLLLIASDPEFSHLPPATLLIEVFRLTPSEARVAIAIAAGRQLAEIAADRGVKIETVRVHSKIVFSKTQTRGQAELTSLLTRLAFPAPVAAGLSHKS
jgi:DNA-binding CsgD family transcriptional regulator